MSLFKRPNSPYWWYKFVFEGVRYQRSTRLKNKKAAGNAESIHRAKLAQARAGIVERRPAPLLRLFAPQFLATVKLERKLNTHRCYSTTYRIAFGAAVNSLRPAKRLKFEFQGRPIKLRGPPNLAFHLLQKADILAV
jgi:hypothetical protein